MKQSAPLLFEYLSHYAKEEGRAVDGYLLTLEPPHVFLMDLARNCRQQIKRAEQRLMTKEIAEMVKGQRVILKERLRDSLARYQMLLDSQL